MLSPVELSTILLAVQAACAGYNLFWPFEEEDSNRRTAVRNYRSTICRYNFREFKSHFRLEKSTAEWFYCKYGKEIALRNGCRSPNSLRRRQQMILLPLWYLSNQEVFRSIADRFNVSKSTAWKYVHSFVDILVQHIDDHIQFPYGREAEIVASKFEEASGIPGIIGAIDGSHIRILKPSCESRAYCNRHSYFSIILQGVCDFDCKFTSIHVGYPGSVHDARVFRNSEIFRCMETDRDIFPSNFHLLGDKAYPCKVNLLVPYRDNGHLTPQQINLNDRINRVRVKIEHSFGRLKQRFRCLKYVNVLRIDRIPPIVSACCILHNICIDMNDLLDEPPAYVQNNLNFDLISDNNDSTSGQQKRDRIKDYLWEQFF